MEHSSTFGGRLARWTARGLMRLYYPAIEVSHRDRIPPSGPALFVANHANSLLDPPVIGWVVQRPVHFFAKSSLFDMPVLGPILHALGMVPAYRGVDDPAQVRRNLETLRAGSDRLVQGAAVGIFPEGKSHDLTRVEMIRSGAGRIALLAAVQGAPVTIVPIGINYERKERFRSSVWVRVGKPIGASTVLHEHGGAERKALRQITAMIEERLQEVVVHLDEPQWQPFLYELEVLLPTKEERGSAGAALRQRKLIADTMNYWIRTDRQQAEAMAAAIQTHRARLSAAGLSIESPVVRCQGIHLGWALFIEPLLLLPMLIPSLAGLIHHLVPFGLTRIVIRRRKHHQGLTWMALRRLIWSLPIYAVWYFLVGAAIAMWFGWRAAGSWLACMPAAGVLAWHYCPRFADVILHWFQEVRMLTQPQMLRDLRREQAVLRERLSSMAIACRKLRQAATVDGA